VAARTSERWEAFVAANTTFDSWEAMRSAAVAGWVGRRLHG